MKAPIFAVAGAVAVCVIVSLMPSGATSEPRAAIRVNQRICYSPCSLSVTVRIVPMAENRIAKVSATDDGGFVAQRSTWELDGEHEPKTTYLQPWIMNAGVYVIQITVYTAEKMVGQASLTVEVISGTGTPRQDPTAWPRWMIGDRKVSYGVHGT